MSQSIRGDCAANTVPPPNPTLDGHLRILLREHIQQLRLIVPVISVAVLALRAQNAELDEDIATILQQHASTPLDLEIDDMQILLDSLTLKREGKVAV